MINYVNKLPLTTINGEIFGLMFMIDGDRKSWTVTYYSHYVKKRDDRFPVIKAASINWAAKKMFDFISKNYPNMLTKKKS